MGRVEIRKKHPIAIRWFHWLNFPVLAGMIWSGLLIYWANDIYRIGFGDTTLIKFFPKGFYEALGVPFHLAEGMAWHFALMWLFMVNGLLYVTYTLISGEWRELLPQRGSFREAWQVLMHDLYLSRRPLPKVKFNGAQRIAYTGIVLMGLGSVLTGWAIYKPTELYWLTASLGGYKSARVIHFLLTIGYCMFFLVHVVQVIRAGWNNFRSMVTGAEVVEASSSTESQ